MRILGLDGGIASIAWAIIQLNGVDGKILSVGVWTFEPPEEGGGTKRNLKNADRRMHRLQRRVLRRRAQRMAQIRKVFHAQGLLDRYDRTALAAPALDPWQLRAAGLERKLQPQEWAVVLGHIAKHRAFRSNSKRDRGANAADDTKKMLPAIERNRELIARYGTVGATFALDPFFKDRKRNRTADFSRSMLRKDQEDEVRVLFSRQASLGNQATSDEFRDVFARTAFDQRPISSSAENVGFCPFEPDQRRTARHSPSFERFRFLSRLATLRLISGRRDGDQLTAPQISSANEAFGSTKSFTFKALRKLLDLAPATRFDGISDEAEKNDIVVRTGDKAAALITHLLRSLLEPAIGKLDTVRLLNNPSALDRAMEIIVFNEDTATILAGLDQPGLPSAVVAVLAEAVRDGTFAKFSGAAHISAKAARNIIPGLLEGLDYSQACEAAGYDHSARPETKVEDIANPVARKALTEMLKQVKVLNDRFGPFDRIHVEMARDIGKSLEERLEIEQGIADRTSLRDRLAKELKEKLGLTRVGGEDLLRYELWREQGGRCLYTDTDIPLAAVAASDNSLQVDHILPWSRFHDNSYRNKTLCVASANAAKQHRTPFEWFSETKSPEAWDAFVARVELCKEMKGGKKRYHYLNRLAKDREQQMISRNLNDTRYACRVLLGELKRHYFPETPHLVAALPGGLTAAFRRTWGIEALKKDKETGKRLTDDRHHALDALVVACVDTSNMQGAIRASQQAEREGRDFELKGLAPPWQGFREEAMARRDAMLVARAPVGRARGEAHKATIRQIRVIDGEEKVFERKPILGLTLADLDRIPVPEPYGKVVDPARLREQMIERLRHWIESGKPKDEGSLPRSPAGDIIRKVRLETSDKVAVRVRDGTADRGDMARVDIFTKADRKGRTQYFAVPVYPHQVATMETPPVQAVQANMPEAQWPVMDASFQFLFSITHMTLVELTKPDGEVITGYWRGLSRNTGAAVVSEMNDSSKTRQGIGLRTLLNIRKLVIDRLGNISEVTSEERTWHGKVCTSRAPAG